MVHPFKMRPCAISRILCAVMSRSVSCQNVILSHLPSSRPASIFSSVGRWSLTRPCRPMLTFPTLLNVSTNFSVSRTSSCCRERYRCEALTRVGSEQTLKESIILKKILTRQDINQIGDVSQIKQIINRFQ